jgi:hypothetical protein
MSDEIEATRTALEKEVSTTGAVLRSFPRLASGLTPDAVKFSPEYRAAKAASDRAFQALRKFNTVHPPRRRRRNGSSLARAKSLYETFHQFEPQKVGSMPSLRIPNRLHHVGEAKVMYYTSDKLNPETGEDEGWIHYFHEHEGDVKMCVTDVHPEADGAPAVPVPEFVRHTQALVRIGDCEGFQYEDFDGKTVEAEGTGRLPEWYATPDGKALLVIQDKRRVIAVLWGGGLDVKAEGVVG